MGLPEDYILPRSTTDAYHLTGDGVVVPVVAWIGANLLSRLGAETTAGASR
jgi:DNA (cytosine-5)-methyltransferase 1